MPPLPPHIRQGMGGQLEPHLFQGSISVPFHSSSPYGQNKSTASLSIRSNLDKFSVKDSGKRDSELNDSHLDISREGFKKTFYQMIAR
ncbi:hypothetical protein AAY473_015445 [Plecturocebus cupreus]